MNSRAGREPEGGAFADLLEGLTAPQAEAVRHTEGALLVLAGPGSGKTRVITRRIAYLVRCGIPPWQVLALTFTNKAAAEMRERVFRLLDPEHGKSAGSESERPQSRATRGLTVTTFHALCARLLRKYAGVAGLPGLDQNFLIYDTDDQTALVKRAIEELDLSTTNWPARSVLGRISDAKNRLIDAEAFAAQAGDFSGRMLAKIYQAYQKGLRAANAADFDDLLLLTAKMLKTSTEVREECRRRWQYLMIDEYQDTNKAQFIIAALLAGEKDPNICVVGDPDQSIYAWRGADIGNILDFEKQFPRAEVIALGENFRSTGHIIGAADALIRHNQRRKHKDLFTSNPKGKKVEAVICRDEHHEAGLVADWLRARREEGDAPAWKDLAVFYRTNALSRVVEDRLRAEGIPYVIARGTAFYQREEVRHALAYLRVVANPADEVSLSRVVNVPARGIGDTTLGKVEAWAAEMGVGLFEALRRTAVGSGAAIGPKAAQAIGKFVAMIDDWRGAAPMVPADHLTIGGEEPVRGSLASLVERVVTESGLEEMYRKARTETDEERIENLAELVSSAQEFEQEYDPGSDPVLAVQEGVEGTREAGIEAVGTLGMLRAYLERVTLVSDADAVDPSQGAVTLMTLHAAKGLEFPAVAMIGLEEGCLPHARVREDPTQLEEERRLCFVGITRAMRRLLITSSRYRVVRGVSERTMVSRFIEELPREHVGVSDQSEFHEPGWDDGGGAGGSPMDRLAAARRAGGAGGAGGAMSAGRAKARDARGQEIEVGSRVRHPQFGMGEIVSITTGQDARAQVKFRDVGVKTLVLQYARLERM
ncbi:MAG: ATP-dependent helicase [Phycisphaerales bacterium]